MLTRALKQAACGLFFFVMCAGVANAGTIGVSPVRVTLSDSQKIGSLSVRNEGTEPITMQMEVLSWSQREGKAVFAATRELLANPPIFTIPAGNSQLVRVGLRRAPDAQRELSYRVILEELPPPPDPDSSDRVSVAYDDTYQPARVCFTRDRQLNQCCCGRRPAPRKAHSRSA